MHSIGLEGRPLSTLCRLASAGLIAMAALTGCVAIRSAEVDPVIPGVVPPLDPAASAKAQALAFYSQALIEENRRDAGAALTNYLQAAALDPDNEELNLRVAVGLIQQKRTEEALAWTEAYADRHPESEKSLLFLALIYGAADESAKVERSYRRLLKLSPQEPQYYAELAGLYSREGRYEDAVRLLERGARRVENPVPLLRLLGNLHIRQSALQKGRDAVRSRRAALDTFERALAIDTNDVQILFQVGELSIQADRLPEALDVFAAIERLQPSNLDLRKKLAGRFSAVLGAEKAVEELDGLARTASNPAQSFYYLGEIHAEAGDTDNAIRSFSLAAQADTNDISPLLKIALIEMEKEPDTALETLQAAQAAAPDDARVLEMTAYLYHNRNDHEAAIEYFEKARETAEKQMPDGINPAFYFNYAVASQMAGHLDDAAQLLAKAIQKNALYMDAFFKYSFRQPRDVIRDQSLAILEKVARIQADDPTVWVYLGLMNSYLESYKAAISSFEKAQSLAADSPLREETLDADFYFWFGAACEREKQIERSEELFQQCIELDPEYAEALNYLAYMWAERGTNLEKALEYSQEALRLEPESGAFVDTLGWIYFMQGKHTEALEQITRAAEMIPDDPTIMEHLGDVRAKLGDEAQALLDWQRSFVLDPDNEAVARKLEDRGIDLAPLRVKAEAERAGKDESQAPQPGTSPEEGPSTNHAPLMVTPIVTEPDVLPGDEMAPLPPEEEDPANQNE